MLNHLRPWRPSREASRRSYQSRIRRRRKLNRYALHETLAKKRTGFLVPRSSGCRPLSADLQHRQPEMPAFRGPTDNPTPAMNPNDQKRFRTWVASVAMVPFIAGCSFFVPSPPAESTSTILSAGALLPSPRLIVGRVTAIDEARRFAFVELAPDAPRGALLTGTELAVRTPALRDSARLQVSPYLRGRTLGTKIMAGQPSPGDEVVWLAP